MKKLEVVYKIINIKSLSNGYGLDDRVSGFRFPAGAGNFSLLHRVQTGSAPPPQPPVQWVQEVKRPGSEADHSPPPSAEVKNAWPSTSTTNRSLWRGA
jgi:hypothetical protein